MPKEYNLTTKEKVKAMLEISGTTDDSVIDTLCDGMTAFIENITGNQRFKLTEHEDEIHDGDDGQWIRLNHRFIYEEADIKVEIKNGSSWGELSQSDYEVYLSNGTVYLNYKITGKRNIKVSYSAGFINIPHDLEMVATSMVSRAYNRRKSQGVANESFEGVNLSWADVMTEAEKLIIESYTRRSFI